MILRRTGVIRIKVLHKDHCIITVSELNVFVVVDWCVSFFVTFGVSVCYYLYREGFDILIDRIYYPMAGSARGNIGFLLISICRNAPSELHQIFIAWFHFSINWIFLEHQFRFQNHPT